MTVVHVKILRRYYVWCVSMEKQFRIHIAPLQVGERGYTRYVQYEQSNADLFVGHLDESMPWTEANYWRTYVRVNLGSKA